MLAVRTIPVERSSEEDARNAADPMRIAALILAVLVIALAAALLLPLFSQPATARLVREPELLAMMAAAPLEAEQVIAVPNFAATWRRFAPLIEPLAESRADARSLSAASWAIGNAPVAIWTTGSGWGALARPDAMHRLLLRLAAPFTARCSSPSMMRVSSGGKARVAGGYQQARRWGALLSFPEIVAPGRTLIVRVAATYPATPP